MRILNRLPFGSELLILLVICAASAHAQVTTATVAGRVLDGTGAFVPGVSVTLANELTGAEFAAITSGGGDFAVTFLPAGQYKLVARKTGFKEYQKTGLQLAVGQRLNLDLTLDLGELSQTVSVTAEIPLVESASVHQQQTLTLHQVEELPLRRRDWSNLLSLAGNANVGSTGSTGGVVMNGLASTGFALTVDGTSASGNPESTSIASYQSPNYINVVSSEAIQEVQFVQGMPSAEVADALSGNVNLITKSGTNELHGSLFGLFQNDTLNARLPFASSRPDVNYKQFGGSVGGPALHNRLFYFFTYDGYRENSERLLSGSVPSAQLKADAIARNPAYKTYLDVFPDPTIYTPGAISGVYQGLASEVRTDNHIVTRLDYSSSRNMISGRYTRGRPYREQPRILKVNSRTVDAQTDQLTLSYTRVQTTSTAETRFGWNRSPLERIDNLWRLNVQPMADLGFGLGFDAEYFAMYGGDWRLSETIGINRGRHSIKLGGRLDRKHSGRDNQNPPAFAFSSAADLLNNAPANIAYPFNMRPYELRNWSLGWFVQDDFRVNRALSLNLGLRHDFYSVVGERDQRMFNRGLFGPLRPPDRSYEPDYNNFSPRFGLAWTLDKQAKTVARAGAGVFHTGPAFIMAQGVVRDGPDAPNVAQITKLEAQQYGLRYPITREQALPFAVASQPGTNFTIDPNLRTAQSYQWLMNIQRAITSKIAVETGYVGTRGLKLVSQLYLNQVDRVTGIRPVPGWQPIFYSDNSDRSTYHSWQNALRTSLGQGIHVNAHYTWSKNLTYLLGDLIPPGGNFTPQDPMNAAADKGRAPTDVRHRFTSDFIYELPFARSSASAVTKTVLRGWQVSGIFVAQSGAPVNLSQGGTLRSQRPDYVGGDLYLDWKNLRPTRGYLNPAAFALVPISPASGGAIRPGNLGRNVVSLPAWWNLDLNAAKNFYITERVRAQFRASLFNALNHTTYSGVDTNLGTGSRRAQFGQFNGTRGARVIQLEGRFTF